MSVQLPSAPFSIGTSSNTVKLATESRVDMSLDDIIKNRQKAEKKNKKDNDIRKKRTTRTSIKGKATNNNSKTITAQKTGGRNQASRKAKTAAKRGLTNNSKPNSADVDREVYRQQRRAPGGRNNQNNQTQNGQRRSRRPSQSNQNGKTEADRKVKARNTPRQTNPPPQKAVSAAVKAMSNAGYKVPNGMKMVISFKPEDKGKKRNANQNKNRKN
jgi:hypothetical protein